MNIAISGASGFIGSHLSIFLASLGHHIIPLNRNMFGRTTFPQLLRTIDGCDVVINLAGAPINHRWTTAYKKILQDSRLITTAQIVKAINRANHPPQLLISTSAVGYYPSSGCHDEYSQTHGEGFLADLCQQWETEARKVNPSVRLAITRFAIVLSPDGGALQSLLQMARMKMAAIIGRGDQPFSWIGLQDLMRAIVWIVDNPSLQGIFNLVAPQLITNAEFTQEMVRHTHTPVTLKIPSSFFRLLYGEGAEFLTQGQCVQPTHLIESGFTFRSENITDFFQANQK